MRREEALVNKADFGDVEGKRESPANAKDKVSENGDEGEVVRKGDSHCEFEG